MEIYKDLSNPDSKEFEQLLNSQFTKTANLEEGKIITGVVNKVTDNFVFLEVPGLKSEPILDINELKSMGMLDKAKVGEKISVLLERLEDKKGEVLVSASKAQKIQGCDKLVEAYEKNEPIMGKITGRVKGGCIVEHIDTGSLMFLPGSQISDKPLKDISHLMNEPQKFALIKLDKVRGNACVSRREIISSFKKEDKIKIVEKFKVGDLIKGAEVKGYSSFGCFFSVNGELDVLVHLQEISYSRVNHPDEVFTIGEKHDLKVISVDLEKLQVGCSLKQMGPDPFENISNYELNKIYKVKVVKLMDFGAFCELEKGLSTLLHSSELSWTKKNISACIESKDININSSIMIIDSIGKTSLLYENAAAAFVGGSLVKKGGHNIIEPAFLECPIIIGTYMFNFESIAEEFLKTGSCRSVYDYKSLAKEFINILDDKKSTLSMTQSATMLISKNSGASAQQLSAIIHELNGVNK